MNVQHGEYVIRELPVERDELAKLAGLHHEVLPSRLYATPEKQAKFLDELMNSLGERDSLVLAGFLDDKAVAYKLGYRTGNRLECFYSWLGGVHPHHRRKGLARALTRIQHGWAREHGYLYVETHTWGDNAPMLILNLQEGFHAVGSIGSPDRPGARVLLRRVLREI